MERRGKLVVGIDFDNTLIIYDDLFASLALERGLLPSGSVRGKREIRDSVRLLADGEVHWQKLQAEAYGPRIREAQPADGVREFFDCCRKTGTEVYIVSHKTELAGYDETGTNLRTAALDWLAVNDWFGCRASIGPEQVFFGGTRREKIEHISRLGCTHFIDDLEETFLEEAFPADVERILYAPIAPARVPRGVIVINSWKDIREFVFGSKS